MGQVSTVVNYFMEDPREASRLERKVDPKAWMKKYLEPHLFPGAEVLCVGCGPGTILRAISNAYPAVTGTGIDISASRIQVAKENNIRNKRLRFFTGDAHQMQFASASFDLVYSRMLLQYAANKESAVNEMVRVCRPGGTVLMQDLDGQLVWHYPEEGLMQQTIERVLKSLSKTGFDPFVGRKLFWLARNAGLENIRVQVECYHLIAGEIDPAMLEQWELKLQIARPQMAAALGSDYEADEEIRRFMNYLRRQDTLTYSNVFTVTGDKPR
jgi:ubiquinone/menaquinone biosynthesis C-methylase UbiE